MRKLDRAKGQRVNKKCTICEVHRQIYDLLVTRYPDSADICDLLDKAYDMGIRMNNRLVEQRIIFELECSDNPDVEKIEELRKLRIDIRA